MKASYGNGKIAPDVSESMMMSHLVGTSQVAMMIKTHNSHEAPEPTPNFGALPEASGTGNQT
jgi:hypothetical protein